MGSVLKRLKRTQHEKLILATGYNYSEGYVKRCLRAMTRGLDALSGLSQSQRKRMETQHDPRA